MRYVDSNIFFIIQGVQRKVLPFFILKSKHFWKNSQSKSSLMALMANPSRMLNRQWDHVTHQIKCILVLFLTATLFLFIFVHNWFTKKLININSTCLSKWKVLFKEFFKTALTNSDKINPILKYSDDIKHLLLAILNGPLRKSSCLS